MSITQQRLDARLWQRQNEDRTDYTDIDNHIAELREELKREEEVKKWEGFKSKGVKIGGTGISKEFEYDDSDEARENEEATEIALSNLE